MRLCRRTTTTRLLLLLLLLSLPTSWVLSYYGDDDQQDEWSAATTAKETTSSEHVDVDDAGAVVTRTATTLTTQSSPRKKKKKKRTTRQRRESSPSSSGCRDYASFQQKKYNRDASNTAYRMAALSSLVYLPFHKQAQRQQDDRITDLDFRLIATRRSFSKLLQCRLRRSLEQYLRPFLVVVDGGGGGHANARSNKNHTKSKGGSDSDPPQTTTTTTREHPSLTSSPTATCREEATIRKREHFRSRHRYIMRYWLYDWREPTVVPGVHYHDTDLLVATSADDQHLVLAFAGTASVADHATNLQTFERSNHSNFFSFRSGGGNSKDRLGMKHNNNQTADNNLIEGSLHRGFLNAYSRVERGSVLALRADLTDSNNSTMTTTINRTSRLTKSLDRRFGNCTAARSTSRKKRRQGCRSRDERLIIILREVVQEALQAGKTVHLSGHSLGTIVRSFGLFVTIAQVMLSIDSKTKYSPPISILTGM